MFENVNILIVEDNVTDGMVLQRLLQGLGISSEIINEPYIVEAIQQHGPADVIFLDLDLAGVNGFDVLAALSHDPAFDGVPIVAYSSHLSEIAAANRAGFHSFIGKPLSSIRLGDQITRILNGESVWEVR